MKLLPIGRLEVGLINTEKVAEFLIATYGEGFKVPHIDNDLYSMGAILTYYAKEIAELREQVKDYEGRIEGIKHCYIHKDDNDTDVERDRYIAFNSGVDAVLSRIAPYVYLENSEKRKDYY